MATEIQEITAGDKAIMLGNAQAARVLQIGSDWNDITIGCRITMDDPGANLVSGPDLCVGIMSTPTEFCANGPLEGSNTGHYIGTWHPGTGSPTWTRTAGPPARTICQQYLYKKVGNTLTFISFNNAMVVSFDHSYRKSYFLHVRKGTPNWDIGLTFPTAWASTDHTYAQFLEAMTIGMVWGFSNSTDFDAVFGTPGEFSQFSAAGAVNQATDGYLNSVVIAWDRTNVRAAFHEVVWAKFA